ncbi:sec1 family transport protein SLY1, partial [Tanacetum coccineum]
MLLINKSFSLQLNDPTARPSHIELVIDKIATGLFSVLSTLDVIPFITCPPDGDAEKVASYAPLVQDVFAPTSNRVTVQGKTIALEGDDFFWTANGSMEFTSIAGKLETQVTQRSLDYFAKKECQMMVRGGGGGIDFDDLLDALRRKALQDSEIDTSTYQYVKKLKSLNMSLVKNRDHDKSSALAEMVE